MFCLPTYQPLVCKHWTRICQYTQHNLNCLVRPCFLHSTQIIIPDTYPDVRILPKVVSSLIHTSVTHPEINTPSSAKTIVSSWPPPMPIPHYLPSMHSISATWMNFSGCNKNGIITCVHSPWSNFKTFTSDVLYQLQRFPRIPQWVCFSFLSQKNLVQYSVTATDMVCNGLGCTSATIHSLLFRNSPERWCGCLEVMVNVWRFFVRIVRNSV